MIEDLIDPWPHHEGRQAGDEVLWLEGEARRVLLRGLRGVAIRSRGWEFEDHRFPVVFEMALWNGWPEEVSSYLLESVAVRVWAIETVDADTDGGNSLALDASGVAHISSCTGDVLKYSTNASGWWITESFPWELSDCSTGTALAVDSAGAVHIVFKQMDRTWEEDDQVHHATNASGQWLVETVEGGDRGHSIGYDPSIAIDPDDAVHVTYGTSMSWDQRYATNSGGVWVAERAGSSYRAVLALDGGGAVHLAAWGSSAGGSELEHATNGSGEWVVDTIDLDAPLGGQHSLGIAPSGTIYVGYPAGYQNGGPELRIACRSRQDDLDNDCDGATW